MLPTAISDQKRMVRALHWQRARYFLRARDGSPHNQAWKLLTIAGPVPHEEIGAIRKLMPRAHITAIDIDENNVLAAMGADVDEAHICDVGAFIKKEKDVQTWKDSDGQLHSYRPSGYSLVMPPPFSDMRAPYAANGSGPANRHQIEEDARFDVLNIDLTGSANDWLKQVVQQWFTRGLRPGGVMMVTFSYGRDVVERVFEEWRNAPGNGRYGRVDHTMSYLEEIPDMLQARVWYILRSHSCHLDSCIQYVGNKMPMISCLLVKKTLNERSRFIQIEPDDYELAVTADDLGSVFACPAERILELRKKQIQRIAAAKAVRTKAEKKQPRQLSSPQQPLLLPAPGPTDCTKVEWRELPDDELNGVTQMQIDAARSRRFWSGRDEDVLRLGAANHTAAGDLAVALNRTEGAVRQKAFSMGLSLETRLGGIVAANGRREP